MKKERDFHRLVRVVYRACRRVYGVEKTQEEALLVFKACYPEVYRLQQRSCCSMLGSIKYTCFLKMKWIFERWEPTGKLKELCDSVLYYLQLYGEAVVWAEDIPKNDASLNEVFVKRDGNVGLWRIEFEGTVSVYDMIHKIVDGHKHASGIFNVLGRSIRYDRGWVIVPEWLKRVEVDYVLAENFVNRQTNYNIEYAAVRLNEYPIADVLRVLEDIMPVVMRIRKLTPRECGRLMGVGEAEIDIIENCGISKSAMYKLYGNSIVTNVLDGIFENLFIGDNNTPVADAHGQLSLF